MNKFNYLIKKILDSEFLNEPFKHIVINDFLKEEHFEELIKDSQIHFREANDLEDLLCLLREKKYKVQDFPGCTSNLNEYILNYKSNSFPKNRRGTPVSSYGITFRLSKIQNKTIKELIDFMNSTVFQSALEKKFKIIKKTNIITAIQKNLSHYEISPHPDIRGKALTYLLNINKFDYIEQEPVHTHLLKFHNKWKPVKDFWQNNTKIERTWVPWEWCQTIKTTKYNNSIVLFAPSNDTLHAAKMIYNHNKFQRTQIYGNLMYEEKKRLQKFDWKQLEQWKEKWKK